VTSAFVLLGCSRFGADLAQLVCVADGGRQSDEDLAGENAALCEENSALREEVAGLRQQLSAFKHEVEAMTRTIAALEKKLGRNSQNSSMPPSSDMFTRPAKEESPNRKARRALGRKPGKQPGAPGAHLAQVDDPTEVVPHRLEVCSCCGADLSAAELVGEEVRQVFEIPEPKIVVTEHRVYKLRCSCGEMNEGEFPPEARAPASYGPRVRGFGLYLLARQHLPFERAAEAMADLLGVECSTGFLDDLYREGAEALDAFLDEVRNQIRASSVVHFDETPTRVKKAKHYFHVACTELLTLLHADVTRGLDAVERVGVLPGYTGTAIHDRLGMYFNFTDARHGVCGAHLLRNLASVGVVWDQSEWASAMTDLLVEMKTAAEGARAAGKKRLGHKVLTSFLERYDTIVELGLAANPAPTGRKRDYVEKESYNLACALGDLKAEVTLFATDLVVPFTNNRAEADLRMVKLQSKISGSFRAAEGAERLAKVRSYLSTAGKHGVDAMDALTALFAGHPWMPPAPTRT
jgi:transposase